MEVCRRATMLRHREVGYCVGETRLHVVPGSLMFTRDRGIRRIKY